MSAPFSTLYLDVGSWDLVADASGNIALAAPPYAVTQDVASACRTFLGEVFYDDTVGIPYTAKFDDNGVPNSTTTLLGRTPPLNVLQGALAAAAVTVPFVAEAEVVISGFVDRLATGQVQFTTDDGQTSGVAI